MSKRYYWLKLNEDFFEEDTIAWLEEQDNGKDYVIFYLKLCLKSLKDDGHLIRYVGEKLIPYDVNALAKLTNTKPDTVAVAMKLFLEIGLISQLDSGEIYMNQIKEMIGSETRQANIMRKKRAKVNQIKKLSQVEKNHIPYIEDYTNRSRYGGNYYNVFNRDEQQCISCGAKASLCVHHIIGFNESDNKTTQMGSMVTLCRGCHSKEHANPRSIINDDILGKIGFDFELYERIDNLVDTHGKSNNVTESYTGVKNSYTEIEIEIDKEKERDNTSSVPYQKIADLYNDTCTSLSKVRAVSTQRQKHIKARWKQFDGDIDTFHECFTKTEASDFCKGKNDRGWKADFDWLIQNDSNMVKVLEGKYDNKQVKPMFTDIQM